MDTVERGMQEAADLTGATLYQFLVQAALEKADKIIDRERVIVFSREDAALFVELLDNPRPANDKLVRAFERHKTKVQHGTLDSTADGST
ncbi:type II toxin-antitoxin system TacA family antitoxin [Duganella sp. S19_KUP01_CR8]|uniref:type II toxin-antitoxin system TacA family antitoxin n=1 Tax=Duganella sp. S19_KUP01_CR8 TaxID=3025502 RepID=UPI002FCDB1C5